MTKPDLTAIALIVDRSGSMRPIQTEAQGALNAFIDAQRKEPGEVLWTIVKFDSEYERPVFNEPCPPSAVTLEPRGMTALNDAIGRTVADLGEALAAMAENERPSKVLVAIITDGYENHSREFNTAQVRELVKRQTDEWNWSFVFLATGIDQFHAERMATAVGVAGPQSVIGVNRWDHAHGVASVSSYAASYRRGTSETLSDVHKARKHDGGA